MSVNDVNVPGIGRLPRSLHFKLDDVNFDVAKDWNFHNEARVSFTCKPEPDFFK